jgi:uncharacterized protein YkwD
MTISKYILGALIAAVLPLSLAACSNTLKLGVTGTIGDPTLALIIAEEVNRYRIQQGTKPLPRHAGLEELAADHSAYMLANRGTFSLYGKNVTHMGACGRALMAMNVHGFTSFSENVAAMKKSGGDAKTAADMVKLWMNSPAHDQAMREKTWSHTGVAVSVADDGTVFATQIFGTEGSSHRNMINRMNSF